MSEPAAPQPPPTPYQASTSGARVPESVEERIAVNNNLTKALVAAFVAKDYDLKRLCALQQQQFLLACQIDGLERAPGNDPLRGILPDLKYDLAAVNAELSQLKPQQPQQPQLLIGHGDGH